MDLGDFVDNLFDIRKTVVIGITSSRLFYLVS